MIVMTYNLFHGAAATGDHLVDLVQQVRPDVLCLQEANGWDDDGGARARDFAARTGLGHWRLGRGGTPFAVGVFARTPLLRSRVHTDGLWHCAVEATVAAGGREIDLWSLHLDPDCEDRRLAEISHLPLPAGTGGDTLVVGDLNSLSAVDGYGPELGEELAAVGVTKFGRPPRFDVLRALASRGLADAAAALGTARPTVPTPANADANHATRLRLDYVLASPGLLGAITSVTTLTGGPADVVSDHYPLVATLGVGDPVASRPAE